MRRVRSRVQSDDEKRSVDLRNALPKSHVGRSPESIEQRKIRDRERGRERWKDPTVRAKHKEAKLLRRIRDPKRIKEQERARSKRRYYKHREKELQRKRNWFERARDKVNEYRRNYYAKNREHLQGIIYDGRRRRNPTYGLHSAINQLERGDITLQQFAEKYGRALALLDERDDQRRTKHRIPAAGSGPGQDSGGAGETNNIDNADETGHHEVREGSD